MRIVLDTCGVLVAAARSLEGASNRILRSLPIDEIEPCLSVALYAEWQEVLSRPENLQARQTPEDAQGIFALPCLDLSSSGCAFSLASLFKRSR